VKGKRRISGSKKIAKWADATEELASVAVNYPQSAYTALQQEWQFVQRVVKDIGDAFTDVEKAISQSFLPALFGNDFEEDDPRICIKTPAVESGPHSKLARRRRMTESSN
jgi:hypothetical protein